MLKGIDLLQEVLRSLPNPQVRRSTDVICSSCRFKIPAAIPIPGGHFHLQLRIHQALVTGNLFCMEIHPLINPHTTVPLALEDLKQCFHTIKCAFFDDEHILRP
jgi:hypothetical protein